MNWCISKDRKKVLEDLVLLIDYRHGRDAGALSKLLEQDHELTEIPPSATNTTQKDLQALADRLVELLERIRCLKEQMAFDLENYHQMVREFDGLVQSRNDNFTRTRVTIFILSRAHLRLAAEITDPAKVDMMGIAKQALEAALPF